METPLREFSVKTSCPPFENGNETPQGFCQVAEKSQISQDLH